MNNLLKKVNLRIFRFNPEVDSKPYYKNYRISIPPGTTLLNALIKVKDERDPTISFRHSCRSSICGSCAMRVNGRPMLACETQVHDIIETKGESGHSLLVEPLKNFPVIKDLVVDLESYLDRLIKVSPWLTRDPRKTPEKSFRVRPTDDFYTVSHVDVCVLCGACDSECSVFDKDHTFIGPTAYLKSARFLYDKRDVNAKGRLKELMELGFLSCPSSDECEVECPKGIEIRKMYKKIKAGPGK